MFHIFYYLHIVKRVNNLEAKTEKLIRSNEKGYFNQLLQSTL